MPFINIRTSQEVTPQKELVLKSAMGQAIALIPGKSEAFLMVQVEEKAHLYLAGKGDEPTAFVEVKVLGNVDRVYCEKLTAEICRVLSRELNTSPDRVYVKFEFVDTWGWNNTLF